MRLSFSSFTACALAAVLLASSAASGQSRVRPLGSLTDGPITPRVELFGGYSYVYPHAPITGTLPNGILPVSACLCSIPYGAGGSLTYNFNHWIGISGDVSGHWQPQGSSPTDRLSKASLFTAGAGPKVTFRARHFAPFGEAIVGVHHLSPQLFQSSNAFGVLVGGGLDIPVNSHIAVRPVQADYLISNHHFGIDANTPGTNLRGIRLQAGVTFLFGGAHHAAPAAAPLPIVAAPVPMAAPAVVNIAPTMQCSAAPAMMQTGESTQITAVGNSAQNHALSYAFTANAGTISGNGAAATLSAAGTAPGIILVTCRVTDEAGLFAEQTVSVQVVAAPVAIARSASALCSMSFARDVRRPTRVDNEAKACLDDIAMNLQRNADAKLILVGSAASAEHKHGNVAAQRAVNAKAYLVTDKGLDASRIAVYSGTDDHASVTTMMVPAGASADLAGDTPVDEAATPGQSRSSHRP